MHAHFYILTVLNFIGLAVKMKGCDWIFYVLNWTVCLINDSLHLRWSKCILTNYTTLIPLNLLLSFVLFDQVHHLLPLTARTSMQIKFSLIIPQKLWGSPATGISNGGAEASRRRGSWAQGRWTRALHMRLAVSSWGPRCEASRLPAILHCDVPLAHHSSALDTVIGGKNSK